MKHQPSEVVFEFLTAVQQHNREKVRTFLHPDIEWDQPGNNCLSGVKTSDAAVMQMGADMGEIGQQTLQLQAIKSISVNGNRVACLIHWTANLPSGKKLDVDNIDVYEVSDGKIIKAKVYSADLVQEDKFWRK